MSEDTGKIWEALNQTRTQVAVQVEALAATNNRLAQGEKKVDTILEKINEVSLSIKGLEINTANLNKATEESNAETKESFRSMTQTIESQRKNIQDQTEKDLATLVKVVVGEHQRTCPGPARRPLTKAQIAAWGSFFVAVVGSIGTVLALFVN